MQASDMEDELAFHFGPELAVQGEAFALSRRPPRFGSFCRVSSLVPPQWVVHGSHLMFQRLWPSGYVRYHVTRETTGTLH